MKIEFTGKGIVILSVSLGQCVAIMHALAVAQDDTAKYLSGHSRRRIAATLAAIQTEMKRTEAK